MREQEAGTMRFFMGWIMGWIWYVWSERPNAKRTLPMRKLFFRVLRKFSGFVTVSQGETVGVLARDSSFGLSVPAVRISFGWHPYILAGGLIMSACFYLIRAVRREWWIFLAIILGALRRPTEFLPAKARVGRFEHRRVVL